jgi:hypothetical protein
MSKFHKGDVVVMQVSPSKYTYGCMRDMYKPGEPFVVHGHYSPGDPDVVDENEYIYDHRQLAKIGHVKL